MSPIELTEAVPDAVAGEAVLEVRDLRVWYGGESGPVRAVDGVSFDLRPGEILGLVGESGCGKSTLGRGLLGLLPDGAARDGELRFRGRDMLQLKKRDQYAMRGRDLGMIFQEPLTRLNPLMRMSEHFSETLKRHHPRITKEEIKERSLEALRVMGIPPTRFRAYPHEFSGGMRQRAMIAMALSCNPKLIIADEPTTALDVTVQAQVLEVLADLAHRLSVAVVLITHDLGVVAGMADQIAVMYAGRVVETGTVDTTFDSTSHPYTAGLLASLPRLHGDIDQPLVPIGGQPPSMLNPPPGCSFHPRCLFALEEAGCMSVIPELEPKPGGQLAACHRSTELLAAGNLVRRVEVES